MYRSFWLRALHACDVYPVWYVETPGYPWNGICRRKTHSLIILPSGRLTGDFTGFFKQGLHESEADFIYAVDDAV